MTTNDRERERVAKVFREHRGGDEPDFYRDIEKAADLLEADAVERRVDVRAIIANVRKWYTEDIMADNKIGKMCRLVCDNILREYEEALAPRADDEKENAK